MCKVGLTLAQVGMWVGNESLSGKQSIETGIPRYLATARTRYLSFHPVALSYLAYSAVYTDNKP